MSEVLQYSKLISLLSTCCFTKKYRRLICLVFLDVGLPATTKSIVDLLSSYTVTKKKYRRLICLVFIDVGLPETTNK